MSHDIRCPRCEARASWDQAFDVTSVQGATPPMTDDGALPAHRWGNWLVRERYPSVAPWREPQGRPYRHFVRGEFGVVKCSRCHHVASRPLYWPAEAFFRWKVRDDVLWAENVAHAQVLLHYIGSALRDPNRYGAAYARGLQRLPATVLASRNRAALVHRITATLRAEGITTTAPARSGH